jgi:hypothetical protein
VAEPRAHPLGSSRVASRCCQPWSALATGHRAVSTPLTALWCWKGCVSRLPYRSVRDTVVVAEWIGLAGVIAGALIAFVGQYLLRRNERNDRNSTLMLEQAALLIALSEDFRNRIWAERKQLATNFVGGWDIGAYRLAEARLRLLSPSSAVVAELEPLRETGKDLGKAWQLVPADTAAIDTAWEAHRVAIERFIAASSRALASGR